MKLKDFLGDSYKDDMKLEDILDLDIEEPKDNSEEITKLKSLISRANGEASKYKKELRAKMSEEDKNKAEQEEQLKAMQDELKLLKTEKAVASQKAELTAIGYDADLAQKGAEAMVNGDLEGFMSVQKTFLEGYSKKVIADKMAGNSSKIKTETKEKEVSKDDFNKMSYMDRLKLKRESPEVYEKLR